MAGPATAEISADQHFWEIIDTNFDRPEVAVTISELDSDQATRQIVANFIGGKISEHVEVVPSETPKNVSLMSSIKEAKKGNTEAVSMVRMNIKTDMIERTIKSGHITEVPLEVNESGQILQFGQTYQTIQANSLRGLRHMKNNRNISPNSVSNFARRVKAETLNSFRIEELKRAGLLEDYSVVVISLFPDDMSSEDASKIGFFADTMSASIQRTGLNNSGELVVESAFVAGKSEAGSRQDKKGVAGIFSGLGINYPPESSTDILAEPILVPNELLKNGVADIVSLYDRALGENVFFGRTLSGSSDYKRFKEICSLREKEYEPNVDMAYRDMMNLAEAISSEVEACQVLNSLSAKYMLMQAVEDDRIDPSVFGENAKVDILQARIALSSGDYIRMYELTNMALKKETSSSCPGGIGDPENMDEVGFNLTSKSKDQDCEFVSKECPMCHKKNVKTVVTSTHVRGACGCSKAK